ncbi:palmitoyltransferase ZDHHC16-like [Watersipora subatra]|uniref:palmitoyltransferase ZDHHC16-like n=1 Tax=Watersipora subatra TaxID=2589382 RepID=UPI00355B4DE8
MFGRLGDTCSLWYWTFFHNHFATSSYIADTLFEPLFWLLEAIAKKAGPIFVTLVTLLTTSVVVIFYSYILPWNAAYWSTPALTINLIIGHWLLLNIVFHYYMAVTTSPGVPPSNVDSPVSICKSCIVPKPPRTHHCSVCKKCVLKMDHHCPWINNCVGHYNHRYFYLFCVYMSSGTIFVCISIYNQFMSYFYGSVGTFFSSLIFPIVSIFIAAYKPPEYFGSTDSSNMPIILTTEELRTRFWVTYEFFLCIAVTFALGTLTVWHGMLISKAETSIEKHINVKEKERMSELGATFKNPYSFGFFENWKIFLGIEVGSGRSIRHVLLPSAHKPTGDGKSWRMSTRKTD